MTAYHAASLLCILEAVIVARFWLLPLLPDVDWAWWVADLRAGRPLSPDWRSPFADVALDAPAG